MVESIHQIGKRENNEDFFLIDSEKRLYIVCDGVGGSNKGEEASQLAAQSFKSFLADKKTIKLDHIKSALEYTEEQFDLYTQENPKSKGMATTITLLHLLDNKALVAHCGDSRVYHVRDGNILFQTKDHSYVQELVDSGYITAEEALTHPKRNQISQAILGTSHPAIIDTLMLNDIRENDYFMLCSDGILESVSNDFIEEKFLEQTKLSDLKKEIQEICSKNSNDNFTAILVKIEGNGQIENAPVEKKKPKSKFRWLGLILLLIAIAAGIYYFGLNTSLQ